jgi:ParB family chromosome partitioning protein
MLALALIENIQREKLNAIEISSAYKRLMDECHLTQEQIAEKVGKDRTTIANSIRLLRLPKKIQDSLIAEEISAGHARALINIDDESIQLQLLDKIKAGSLSVRKVEKLVSELTKNALKDVKNKTVRIKKKAEFFTPHLRDVEDKLRTIFGTKVDCKQRSDGSGEIILEYYSNTELERLLELFEVIDKHYN